MDPNQTIFSSFTFMFDEPEKRLEVYNVCMDEPMKAGFLLGPSIPTGPLERYKKMLFPLGSPDILNTVSSFGFTFFLFLMSVQMDLSLIRKTGKKAWVIAVSSYIIPIFLGFFMMGSLMDTWYNLLGDELFTTLPVVFVSQSGCSFAVVSNLLNDVGILNSEIGRLALSTAFLNDLGAEIMAGFVTLLASSMELSASTRIRNTMAFFVYLICVPLIFRPAMKWVVKNTPEGKPVDKIYTYGIIIVLLGLGYFAGHFHLPFLSAAVMFGLSVPEGPPLGSQLVCQLELFATWFLTSIFVTCCVMKVDLTEFVSMNSIYAIAFFIALVYVVKMLICMGICHYCNMPLSDGFCLALILTSKGVVDICSYTLIYDIMAQSKQMISILVISVIIIGTSSSLGVKAMYDPTRKYAGYQKRNLMSLKNSSDLRLVACIHKSYHTVEIKNVLQVCSPAPENIIVADILHLKELVGRVTPIFIAHKLQQKLGSSHNYSGEVIRAFDLFERDYAGCATANTYTAISPVAQMHEDVCHLALDKSAALIILPFHVKWEGDGSVESEDINIRSLNAKVLERAPCSIAILVNRGISLLKSVPYKVALIFLGGPDDREALCLAKRFAKNLDNTLFVYRLVAHNRNIMDWEYMIDDEELRKVRGAYGKLENVTYEETIINDASQTTCFIKEIANKFDFIVVGRRYGVRTSQTSGLENWIEYSELGVIGDLLASPDMETKASILVVQQQQSTRVPKEILKKPKKNSDHARSSIQIRGSEKPHFGIGIACRVEKLSPNPIGGCGVMQKVEVYAFSDLRSLSVEYRDGIEQVKNMLLRLRKGRDFILTREENVRGLKDAKTMKLRKEEETMGDYGVILRHLSCDGTLDARIKKRRRRFIVESISEAPCFDSPKGAISISGMFGFGTKDMRSIAIVGKVILWRSIKKYDDGKGQPPSLELVLRPSNAQGYRDQGSTHGYIKQLRFTSYNVEKLNQNRVPVLSAGLGIKCLDRAALAQGAGLSAKRSN
ncbi:hypothetical protein Fmac_026701 [Flemingia macrophylla]|uniref:Cation/H+ exchanger domain-containing protein n=1 Tax=Flemingia macrophylla TaxID=520843 RepID=A0ABD1LFT0_9FABA